MLDEILSRLDALPAKDRKLVADKVPAEIRKLKFIPSPGPQTRAYLSKADILLFGGEPGGGKTGLLIGLAVNEHDRSLIVRKQFADLEGVIDNAKGIVGSSNGFVGGSRPKYSKDDGGVIHFEGMAQSDDFDTGKQGNPHDGIFVDEGAQMTLNQILLLYGWNRTKNPGQRCRLVIATNPPVDSIGDWMADFFGPWLNPTHPRPAKDGELRWFIMNAEGESQEVDGPNTVIIDSVEYYPHSRTYINSKLEDNPFLDAKEYRRRLQAIPEPYRTMLTSGNFMLARKDQDFQVIPTAWILEAQARWTPKPPENMAMTAMFYDPAGGGKDSAELAMRYGGWYAPLISDQGEHTADGSTSAALIVQHRRDAAAVAVDCDGGYGGAVCMRLGDNQIEALKYKGSEASTAKTKDGALSFANKRSEACWKFREELDPSQEGGSAICLPPDAELRSDLAALTWKLTSRGIQVEPKVIIGTDGKITGGLRKKLGRSPGKGDAVIGALAPGDRAVIRNKYKSTGYSPTPQLGYAHLKKRRA